MQEGICYAAQQQEHEVRVRRAQEHYCPNQAAS